MYVNISIYHISHSPYICLYNFVLLLFSVDTNMERNLYRICILFSNPNKILFKSSQSTAVTTPSKMSAILLTSVYIHVLKDQWITIHNIPLTQLRSHTIRSDIYHVTFIVHTNYIGQYGLERK